VQIGSIGRVLLRVHRAGCLADAEHRATPTPSADRLDAALAHLLDRGVVVRGGRWPRGEPPGSSSSVSRRREPDTGRHEIGYLAGWCIVAGEVLVRVKKGARAAARMIRARPAGR